MARAATNRACPHSRVRRDRLSNWTAISQRRANTMTAPTAPSSNRICSAPLCGCNGTILRPVSSAPKKHSAIYREPSNPHPRTGFSAIRSNEKYHISTRCRSDPDSQSARCHSWSCISRIPKGSATNATDAGCKCDPTPDLTMADDEQNRRDAYGKSEKSPPRSQENSKEPRAEQGWRALSSQSPCSRDMPPPATQSRTARSPHD